MGESFKLDRMKQDDFMEDLKALCWQYWKGYYDISHTVNPRWRNMSPSKKVVITFMNKDYESK